MTRLAMRLFLQNVSYGTTIYEVMNLNASAFGTALLCIYMIEINILI